MSQKPQSHPQPVAPIQRLDPTDPFQATSRAPISPGPNLHVPDPAYARACLREYNLGQMQNVLHENADGKTPISYSHLRVIRAVIDRTMDDSELNNHIRDLAIVLITHRVEQCIREQRESPGYPAFPQDQRAMNLLEALSAERELCNGRLPEPTAAESRRAHLRQRRKDLKRAAKSGGATCPSPSSAIVSEANNPSGSSAGTAGVPPASARPAGVVQSSGFAPGGQQRSALPAPLSAAS